eukprot:823000-Amphidinium_carterae.1
MTGRQEMNVPQALKQRGSEMIRKTDTKSKRENKQEEQRDVATFATLRCLVMKKQNLTLQGRA